MKNFMLLCAGILSCSISATFPVDALLVLVVLTCFTLRETKGFTFAFLAGAAGDLANPAAAPAAPFYACLGLAQSFSARFVFRVNVLTMLPFILSATVLKWIYLSAFLPLPVPFSEIRSALPGFLKEMAGNILISPLYYFALLKK